MFENYSKKTIFGIFDFWNISEKCENSIELNTKIHFIFNFPNQMFQFLFFWSWIGPNKVMTVKKPWNYFEKPMSSSDPVWLSLAKFLRFGSINRAANNMYSLYPTCVLTSMIKPSPGATMRMIKLRMTTSCFRCKQLFKQLLFEIDYVTAAII